jgi:hypothetical protein
MNAGKNQFSRYSAAAPTTGLPFVFLYGMRMFAVLCALLASAGLGLALYAPPSFAAGAWVTCGLLLAFDVAGRWLARREA